MPIPTNRTTANTPAEHVGDHNLIHAFYNNFEGYTPASFAQVSHTHTAAQTTSGTFAVARLGTGASTTSTFLRGGVTNGSWSAVSSADLEDSVHTLVDSADIDWTADDPSLTVTGEVRGIRGNPVTVDTLGSTAADLNRAYVWNGTAFEDRVVTVPIISSPGGLLASSTAQQSLISGGTGTFTFPANSLSAGDTVDLIYDAAVGVVAGTVDFSVALVLGGSDMAEITTSPSLTGAFTSGFQGRITLRITSIGVSGVAFCTHSMSVASHTVSPVSQAHVLGSLPTAINTTGTLTLDLQATKSSAAAGFNITSRLITANWSKVPS